MSPLSRNTLVGLGVGVAAAGVASVAGVAIDRLWRDREQAIALGDDEDFRIEPSQTLVVVADDGVPLHVEIDEPDEAMSPDEAGEGARSGRPTVVLSHGYTLDLRSWFYQRQALHEAGYRVVAWDQRGHGSSGTGDVAAYTVDQLGADLLAVLDAAAPEGDLVLVGHSMGGMTVMALAEAQPRLIADRVLAVGLISTSPGGLDRVTWGLGPLIGGVVNKIGPLAMGRLAGRQELVDVALRGGRPLEEFLVARSSFASPVPMAVVRLTAEMIFGTSMEVMAAYVPGLSRHDKVAALEHLQGVEVLVLNGDHDVLTAPVHSDEIIAHLPGAEHVLVTDGGHVITLEHPELVSRHLLELIRRGERAVAGDDDAVPGGRRGHRHTVTDLERRRRAEQARPRRRRTKTAS